MLIIKIYRKICLYFSRLRNLWLIKKYGVKIGEKCILNGTIYFSGKCSIKIGNNVRVNSGKNYNVIGGASRTIFRTINNGKIIIGNRCGISNSAIISQSSIILEDDILIGGNCKIFDTDFHPLDTDKRISNQNTFVKSKPIHIKSRAFIGAHSIILKGVTIGENSIVGAGSVVTKDIPSNEIWAGNPAKFIRKI